MKITEQFLQGIPETVKQFIIAEPSDKQIIYNSGLPFIKLDLDIPYQQFYNELIEYRNTFFSNTTPRKNSRDIYVKHLYYRNEFEDWKRPPDLSIPMRWTSHNIPTIKDFFSNKLGQIVYGRVQCDILGPGGFIANHIDLNPYYDGKAGQLASMNIAITNPASGCYFKIENYGTVPFEPGAAFLIDTSKQHAVFNDSDQERYHLKVHIDFEKSVFSDPDLIRRSFYKSLNKHYCPLD